MPITNRVAELARQRGLTTVKAFADQSELAYGTAHALWNQKTQRIDYDTLERLCVFFGVEPGEIFVRTPKTPA